MILLSFICEQVGLIPDSVNLIHTATRQETIDTWNYNFQDSNAPVPVRVNTNPKSSISLKYKRKTEEWTKDDFDPIRHMKVLHFAMPLAISGLAVAFKIASDWSEPYGQASIRLPRSIMAPDAWFQVLSFIGAFIFVFFFLLYSTRMYMFPKKCWKDWHCPLRSSGFGMIPVVVMFYAFLIYDEINKREPGGDEENSQTFARVLWWIGSVSHTILTVAKTGEWIGRRMELEHVHPHWMIFPIGLSVAAFVAPVVGVFADDNERAGGNAVLARFFYSFAWLMWITLFALTFYKVVTQHNTDDRLRHGVFLWLATPCTLGLAEYGKKVLCRVANRSPKRSSHFLLLYPLRCTIQLSATPATYWSTILARLHLLKNSLLVYLCSWRSSLRRFLRRTFSAGQVSIWDTGSNVSLLTL
jgi:tellurite resistance protein TehA-like permease